MTTLNWNTTNATQTATANGISYHITPNQWGYQLVIDGLNPAINLVTRLNFPSEREAKSFAQKY